MAIRNTSPGHFQCCVIINVHAAAILGTATRNTSPGHFQCRVSSNVHTAAIAILGITAGDGAGLRRAAVHDGQGHSVRTILFHMEHAAVAGHPQCTAVQVEGQVFCNLQRGMHLRIGAQFNRIASVCLVYHPLQGRFGGGHQGICYIP